MTSSRKELDSVPMKRPPATTPAARENQLISLAVDLAERQLSEGTASSQVVTHYLKLATTREELEKKKIEREIMLLDGKIESLEGYKRIEALYSGAIEAMKTYQGAEAPDLTDMGEYDQ